MLKIFKKSYSYFISFKALDKNNKLISEGNQEITIDKKISGMSDIMDIGDAILKSLHNKNLATDANRIFIVSYALFD